jgi:3-mercaptopyruvate sulfurtransferase SseA
MRLRIPLIMGLVVAAALVLACNSNEKRASNVPTPPRPTASPAISGEIPTVSADGVRRVTTVELRDLLAKHQAFVVDVRNEASYSVGHIRGARLMPSSDILKHVNELPKDKLIVTYCS